eukprot:4433422-Alexandrium_andersonii.AAC.1
MGQRVEVSCQQLDVDKAHLSKRKLGIPVADDAKKFFLEHGRHRTRCDAQFRRGNFAQLRKAEQ